MKENKQPILSICIPTYNRGYIIEKTINSVVMQKEFQDGNIELIISDNASTDDTKTIVGQFQKKYSNIKYFENESNIGAMRNILKAYSLGTGQYLWCLGSDDYLIDGCLKKTIGLINSKFPDIIIHRYGPIKKFNRLKDKYLDSSGLFYCFPSQKDYFDFIGDQFVFDKNSFDTLESQITRISGYIISSEHFKKSKNNIIREKGDEFFHKFNFIQSLLAHSVEIENLIILFNDSYVEPDVNDNKSYQKKLKKSHDGAGKKENIVYVYYKESKFLSEYLINKYRLAKNCGDFFKGFVRFWKLLYIANIPFFSKLKGVISLENRRKLGGFFAKFG